MRINTYTLTVYFYGYERTHYNLSSVAVKRYISYHEENPDFYGYALD